MAGHLKPFLEQLGYQIAIVPAADILEASRMVAEGKAELSRWSTITAQLLP